MNDLISDFGTTQYVWAYEQIQLPPCENSASNASIQSRIVIWKNLVGIICQLDVLRYHVQPTNRPEAHWTSRNFCPAFSFGRVIYAFLQTWCAFEHGQATK